MEETFLCFEIEAALFLLPLEQVDHIIPGNDSQESVYYGAKEVRLLGLCRLSGTGGARGKYVILLNGAGERQGLSADEVRGIYHIPSSMQKDIPTEAIGCDNSCLIKAAYVNELDSWAFIVKPDRS